MALECRLSKDVSVIGAQGKFRTTLVCIPVLKCIQNILQAVPNILEAVQIAVFVSTIVILKEFPFLHHSSAAWTFINDEIWQKNSCLFGDKNMYFCPANTLPLYVPGALSGSFCVGCVTRLGHFLPYENLCWKRTVQLPISALHSFLIRYSELAGESLDRWHTMEERSVYNISCVAWYEETQEKRIRSLEVVLWY